MLSNCICQYIGNVIIVNFVKVVEILKPVSER